MSRNEISGVDQSYVMTVIDQSYKMRMNIANFYWFYNFFSDIVFTYISNITVT